MAKKLSIQLDIKEIEDEKIELINRLLKNHSGNNNLSFQVFDNDEKIMVDLDSQKQKIDISSDLLSKLDDNKILYKLNQKYYLFLTINFKIYNYGFGN